MVKKEIVFLFVVILSLSLVSAFSLSDFFKGVFGKEITGKAVDGAECGKYSLIIPVNASASGTSLLSSTGKAIDENESSYWYSTKSLPAWIYFDLGSRKCINGFEIYAPSVAIPIEMDIAVSDDAQNWVQILKKADLGEGGKFVVFSFGEIKGRYIRVYQMSTGSDNAFVSEIRINASNTFTNELIDSNCTDSDEGKRYDVYGKVNLTNSSGNFIFSDECVSERESKEYYCDGKEAKEAFSSCSDLCVSGVCVVSENADRNIEIEEISNRDYCGNFELASPRRAMANSQFNNYKASNAIDGDVNTHWFGDPGKDYPKWIFFDLGERRCMNSVELGIFFWDVPIIADVEISDDAQTWTKVALNSELDGNYQKIDFEQTIGRYVRIYEKSGKRGYGTLSEIKVNSAELKEISEKIKVYRENLIAGPEEETYYIIGGNRVYLKVDDRPIEVYFENG